VDRGPRAGPDARLLCARAARRGAQVAAVATARKRATLFWCLLTREQHYAFGQPSLARRKIRRLKLAAGAPSRKGQVPAGHGLRNKQIRDAERALAIQAENALPAHDRRPGSNAAGEGGRERDTGTRIKTALEGPSRAADHKSLTSALRSVNHSRPPPHSHRSRHTTSPLDAMNGRAS
jgi:hypothetical protein